MDALATAGSRSCGGTYDLGGGRRQARNRRGGASPDDEPSLFWVVLREVQGPGAGREGLSRIPAAADGVRGAGAARSRISRRDLALGDAARLERPLPELPPPGAAHNPLRPLEGRSCIFLAREPALSGRGPETRHGAIPATKVQADGGDLRLYAQRSRSSSVLVRRGLAAQAQDSLRNAP